MKTYGSGSSTIRDHDDENSFYLFLRIYFTFYSLIFIRLHCLIQMSEPEFTTSHRPESGFILHIPHDTNVFILL